MYRLGCNIHGAIYDTDLIVQYFILLNKLRQIRNKQFKIIISEMLHIFL